MSRYNYTLHATSFTHPTVGSTDSTTQSLVQADFNSITPPPHVQFNKSISIMKKNVILTSFPLLASVNTDQLSLYMEPGSEWLKDQYKEPYLSYFNALRSAYPTKLFIFSIILFRAN
eukprot:TRINITY_DN3141_c0_g1_i3.p1 TRINITY_DN3141_c0_g1~~TRINITY_DN3141_c0_g1_i3.p1  ORF type:complete len:117 (-),score=3.96 TRINITY_DN3141_c0_g1_i3:364-714(-)